MAKRIPHVLIALLLGLFVLSCSDSSLDVPEPPSSSSLQADVPSSSSSPNDAPSSSSLQADASSSSSSPNDAPSSSSLQVDAPSSSSLPNDAPSSSSPQVNAPLKAQPVATSKNPSLPETLVSWTDGEKNYYVIDAGEIRHTFISAIFGPEHYDGFHQVQVSLKDITTSTVTTSTTETVSKSIAVSNTLGVKLGLEEAIKATIPGFGDLSAKLNLEISETVNVSTGRTTSTSVSNIDTYVKSQEISRTMTFGSNGAPAGFYRYALYGVSDVYFVISTSLDNQTLLSWEVISCVRPDGYLRHMDYSSDGNFDNSPIAGNEIVFAEGFHKTLQKPTLSRIKKTETKEFTASGSYTFDKGFPATIEVYALGAGGGGQGGHFSDLTFGGYGGTGGAGGGGAAAYMSLNITQPTNIGVVIGNGGAGGSGDWVNWVTDWRSGYPGENGENTTVTLASAGTSTILTAKGGLGGGGSGQILNGGSGGTESTRPANILEINFATAAGGNGSNGVQGNGNAQGDIQSKGGNSGGLAIGSISPFGGSGGAVRNAGQRPPDGSNGGGGASDISTNNASRSGSKGGNGEVRIVVTYYE